MSTARTILILNGPNLNMLGRREPDIYGRTTLAEIRDMCRRTAEDLGFETDFRQTNAEGTLVDWVQEAADGKFAGLIINAAAYTHTSLALQDALKILDIPVIEVHISDPKDREPVRHTSLVEPCAAAVISGQGPQGYTAALDKLASMLS